MSLFEHSEVYSPKYHALVEYAVAHEKVHWIEQDVNLQDDVEQYKRGAITEDEKQLLKSILRLFTEADKSVAQGYVEVLIPLFKNNEARSMLISFAARECFDDKTDILTQDGWKRFKDLTDSDKVAQYDKDSEAISFVYPLDKVEKHYTGLMHHYKSRSTDICVTPKHRLYLKHPSSGVVQITESEKGKWGDNYLYPNAGYKQDGETILSDMERLLIAIQADGTVRSHCPSHSDTKKTVDINVKKKRKVKRVIELLSSVGLNCNPRLQDSGFTVFTFTLPESVDHFHIKDMGFIELNSISSIKAREIIDEVLFWDGTKVNGSGCYYNTNEQAVDKIQAICAIGGISARKGINKPPRKNVQIANNLKLSDTKACYALTICQNVFRTYPHREEIPYDGKVYCVTVPTGLIVTRRGKRTAISGNCIHQRGYALLNDTLGYGEDFYYEFLDWAEMKEKAEFMLFQESTGDKYRDGLLFLAKQTLVEGISLFASFVMLLNFDRKGKMPGMVDVVKWSINDEGENHVTGNSYLFKLALEEKPYLVTDDFKLSIYNTVRELVRLEDAFIDVCFENRTVADLNPEDVKQYIRYIADIRLIQLGLKPNWDVSTNPLPWVDTLIGKTEASFFERQVVEYSKANLSGEWVY